MDQLLVESDRVKRAGRQLWVPSQAAGRKTQVVGDDARCLSGLTDFASSEVISRGGYTHRQAGRLFSLRVHFSAVTNKHKRLQEFIFHILLYQQQTTK